MIGFFIIIAYSDKFNKLHKLFVFACTLITFFSEPGDLIFYTRCPNCLDDELCESLHNGTIHMHWPSQIIAIIHPRYTKSVFFARSDDLGEIVLKSMTERGRTRTNPRKYESRENVTESIIKDNVFTGDDKIQNVILCPNIKSVQKLLEPIDKNLENLANSKYLWLDFSLSIEPMLLKFMSQVPKLNVPKFYGACGDLIFTEYKGQPLTNYFNSNWKQRLFLSFQLLEMADALTFFHSSLVFYLKDISPDNIVVNSSGIISLIDLDNVIISERMEYENYALVSGIHVSRVIDPGKMCISPSEICGHALSDHNYYSVCKYILLDAGVEYSGLLKDIPTDILKANPNFLNLLEECGTPKVFANRISAGKHLIEVMKEILVNSKFYFSVEMVGNFSVFKKSSPNGKLTLYLGKRDFVDHMSSTDAIDGVVLIEKEYLMDQKVFAQIICSFRYGREEDEVMGLTFQKDIYLASVQIYPPQAKQEDDVTKLQERLMTKLGSNAYPFTFTIPASAPTSVTLQQGPGDEGEPCGVQYFVKIFAGQTECDKTQPRSVVTLRIRKVQFAPSKQGKQPCAIVRKDFMLSAGELELEATLDKQLYHHGEKIAVNICIRNHSNKVVKRIKAMIQQGVDILLFQNGQFRSTVACVETQEGCPIQPGSSLQKVVYLLPTLESNKNRRGIATEGRMKDENNNLASSTLLPVSDGKDAFGIIVSYTVKVKLYLGALGGELSAELPMLLMNPKPAKYKTVQDVGKQLEPQRDSGRNLQVLRKNFPNH